MSCSISRRIAVALPAMNEADHIEDCIGALLAQAERPAADAVLSIHVFANNCRDRTAAIVERKFGDDPRIRIRAASLLPEFAHAGWARRLAMEAAAEALDAPDDVLLSTDADTIVAKDWLNRNLAHLDRGFEAVAGLAIIRNAEWRGLTPEQRARLVMLRKYHALLAYLRRGRADPSDPWPHHGYEGGASIALTFDLYRRIGGCPPVPVGEDRALFDAIRTKGGRIRHALDVKVFTSGRLVGRAQGGVADTLRGWCTQPADLPIHETWTLNAELGHAEKCLGSRLTFRELGAELDKAAALTRASRAADRFALSA